ncbi:MAG: aminotransferase class V-fold PLP-dependent enzyme, partial [Clostridia bacterium]|nr:aminotransferase class V-fold PLP-dependent enzyme [Clostridia bacterium]
DNNIDLYTINAHKIGAVKGCGGLIKKKNLQIKPYLYGGGQEQGFRSGTENVFAVKCFEYAALDRYSKLDENFKKVSEFNKTMRKLLDSELFTILSSENASPYILSIAAKGVRGETILHEADDNGLIIGTGSACSSNQKKRYSRVILSCGVDEVTADGVLRLSFSPENTLEEIKPAADILNRVVANRKRIMA